jgi:hypothetical protein
MTDTAVTIHQGDRRDVEDSPFASHEEFPVPAIDKLRQHLAVVRRPIGK